MVYIKSVDGVLGDQSRYDYVCHCYCMYVCFRYYMRVPHIKTIKVSQSGFYGCFPSIKRKRWRSDKFRNRCGQCEMIAVMKEQ